MRFKQTMNRWLSAERARRESAAEEALGEVFALLVEPSPSPGFAAAVMRRIEGVPVVAAVPVAMRWAIAVAMVAAACSAALVPAAWLSFKGFFEVGASVELVSSALVAGSAALASWLELWQSMAELDRVLLGIVSKPLVAAPLVAILGISLAALTLFSRLTASDRSTDYV